MKRFRGSSSRRQKNAFAPFVPGAKPFHLTIFLIAFSLVSCGRRSAGPVEIVYWTGWSSNEFNSQQGLIDEFNRTHPNIHVRLLSQFGNSGYQKVRIAFAGDSTPDIMSTVWADELASYAQRGVLTPLDAYLKASGRDFDKEFVPSLRKSLRVDGQVYGLAVTTNSHFIIYNRDIFEQSHVNENQVLRSPDALFAASRACTKAAADGSLIRYGFRPEQLVTWALVFGGKWYDPAKGVITANDPHNVAALRWMTSFNKIVDPMKSRSFQASFGSDYSASGPFFVGKVAMRETGEWAGKFLHRYAPNLRYGFFALPAPQDGRPGAFYGNGSVFVIPKACRHKEEAWEFLNWITSEKPVEKFCETIGNVPALVAAGQAPAFQKSPLFQFAVALSQGENAVGPPGIAIWPTYSREIARTEESVIYGGKDAQNALDELQRRMETEFRETKEDLSR
ncbi:MAG TPA: ABC transporter substrate-binding protein [Fimbriimonas sp.]|nr:ABC transporter substrate-binding protein [Fimbriimonas sp.]